MNMKEVDCKYCGESIEIPEDEYIASSCALPFPNGDYAHFECQMDYEELTTYSPVDLF